MIYLVTDDQHEKRAAIVFPAFVLIWETGVPDKSPKWHVRTGATAQDAWLTIHLQKPGRFTRRIIVP